MSILSVRANTYIKEGLNIACHIKNRDEGRCEYCLSDWPIWRQTACPQSSPEKRSFYVVGHHRAALKQTLNYALSQKISDVCD